MNFHIPLTISPLEKLRQKSRPYQRLIKRKKKSNLEFLLQASNIKLTREEYISIVIRNFVRISIFGYVVISTGLAIFKIGRPLVISIPIAILVALFLAMNQLVYPKIFVSRKEKIIERNLIPALQDIMVQINSGVPLYSVFVNISASDYGELSQEFKKAVKKINTGTSQTDVLDELGEKNASRYFRRTLWQISNGMKAGSDISHVIRENIRSLNEEQVLQIQNYGNKLNPLIMFYMLISIVLPALAITFLTIVSSLISLSGTATKAIFIGLFIMVMLIQVMFLGAMKSARPSLLT